MTFYIENISSGLIVDIKENDPKPGAEIIMYPNHGGLNQIWKWKNGMILSKLNGLALTINDQSRNALTTSKPQRQPNQIWYLGSDDTINNEKGLVMDVELDRTEALAPVIAFPKHGRRNQKFRFVYV